MAAPAPTLCRRFEAVIFDWDGTAVPDRAADASALRATIESACALGLELAVVSGTHVANIDAQLAARPHGPGELHLLLNRGSEVFRVGPAGPQLLERRQASEEEEAALDRAAERTVALLNERGLDARVVSQRLNRRKIDLIAQPGWEDPPKARIAELLAAVQARLRERGIDGLAEAVRLAEAAALAAGLEDARVTSDAKHVEIGLTDKSDSARWWMAHLWRRGVWPQQLLIAGDELGPLGGLPGSDSKLLIEQSSGATVASVGVEPAGLPAEVIGLGGGPARFLELLRAQLQMRRDGALPIVAGDPRWTLRVEQVVHESERARESLLTVADGLVGTRGSVLARSSASKPSVVIEGAYRHDGEWSELQQAPLWNRLAVSGLGARVRRTLDLHAGLLAQERQGLLSAVQFASLAEPGLTVLRALGRREELEASPPLVEPARAHVEVDGDGSAMRIALANGRLEAAAVQSVRPAAGQAVAGQAIAGGAAGALERIAAYALSPPAPVDAPAARRARAAHSAGVEGLLSRHRCAWARRWEQADVVIGGDPDLQLAVRLALYHLISSTADRGEAAVGARGLSGGGYRGHVFWDSDIFVLPFFAATHPPSARAILEYRVRRLAAAQRAARVRGRRGARFAWESAAGGNDVTPRTTRDRAGHERTVHTGEREEHIVADVAWAAACYIDWTGDLRFRAGPGKGLIVETARYWASRIERDADGSAHIRGVIGPDEYHEQVDDNAYTNVMARWNLRRAYAESCDGEVDRPERESWLELAEALADGYRPERGLYEQFAGFFELEPLVIAQLAPRRPIAADLLLGGERVEGAQVIKQADVLMLHHLIPEELAPGALGRDLAFYEPRTAHASSLSPGIHAALLARAGMLAEALAALSLAARIDLDDISASTAAGVHIAAMGSVWQALAYGFLGARPRGEVLVLDPQLPDEWRALELRLRFRGVGVRVLLEGEQITISSERSLLVALAGSRPVLVDSGGYRRTWRAPPADGR